MHAPWPSVSKHLKILNSSNEAKRKQLRPKELSITTLKVIAGTSNPGMSARITQLPKNKNTKFDYSLHRI